VVRFPAELQVGPGSGLSLSKRLRPATKIFTQQRKLLSPVTVEAIELIKPFLKNDYLCIV